MSLSQDDLECHKEILSYLSMTLSTVLTDLDIFIPGVYHINKNIWTEVFKLNSNRVNVLTNTFEDEFYKRQNTFEDHGLTGTELQFKYSLIKVAYTHFSQNGRTERWRKWWLSKLFRLLDDYLDSLEGIIPSVSVIKEFKSFVEHSISHSEPRGYSADSNRN